MPDDSPAETSSAAAPETVNGGGPSTWEAPPPQVPPPFAAVRQIEQNEALDGPAGTLSGLIKKAVPHGPVKDALSGTWLGHALHPVLTDVVIGTWLSALLLDVVGGEEGEPGADRLVALGLVAALPTAATGASDWSDMIGKERRVGLVHAVSNYTALGLWASSLSARRRDRRGTGRALGMAASAVLLAGGYLGGHLSHARGMGVDETAFTDWPEDWTAALPASEVPSDGSPAMVDVEGVAVLVSRQDGRLAAIANRCTHLGGSLGDGEASDGCVECPLHGSTFSLVDGSVRRGPAVAPAPAFDVRVRDGQVEVRAAAREVA